MTLDVTKPVQMEDGRPARIICTDAKGRCPVVALVSSGDIEDTYSYSAAGQYLLSEENCPTDLVNIPRKLWVNVYKVMCDEYWVGTPCMDREEADVASCGQNRIACISFTEGEGL